MEGSEVSQDAELPVFLCGHVVRGKGRGSRDLGCPTANLSASAVEQLPEKLASGVYYGWAAVDKGEVYGMLTNIGWCPYFGNKDKSVETHILHQFDGDFYGSILNVCIVGYLRPEKNFSSLNELIEAIKLDIENGKEALKSDAALEYKNHSHFK